MACDTVWRERGKVVCLFLTLNGVKEESSVFVSDTEWRERGK